ncbi:CLUMA_CG012715, isoform A [Clunio marinus]|uniref:CLUMA_CG012715, isoform A n=1 Tax=Clunio marinus TaxID=568069 RepID=A0A1J1ILM4_9DIPT|nr:CLUMA_CG012715, isoform A [Clunio marinus]
MLLLTTYQALWRHFRCCQRFGFVRICRHHDGRTKGRVDLSIEEQTKKAAFSSGLRDYENVPKLLSWKKLRRGNNLTIPSGQEIEYMLICSLEKEFKEW